MNSGVRRDYKDSYQTPYSPLERYFAFGRKVTYGGRTRRVWRFRLLEFLFDRADGVITGCYAWRTNVSPSYGRALSVVWDNICTWCTPFYRPRRALLNAVVNGNGTKLLDMNRKSAYVRNRRRDCTYCDIRCGFVNATVTIIRYVDNVTKNGVCTFISGTDNTTRETKVVAVGPCLTWRQCERLFDKIVEATPELEWYTE